MKTKICRKSGCGRTCDEGKKYCAKHQELEGKKKIFTKRGKSGEYHNLYGTARWKRTSREFLKKYPFCFICGAKATITDHITPHRGNLDLFFDDDNLQPMCWACHSRKTFAENKNFNGDKNGSRNERK